MLYHERKKQLFMFLFTLFESAIILKQICLSTTYLKILIKGRFYV